MKSLIFLLLTLSVRSVFAENIDLKAYEGRTGRLKVVAAGGVYTDILECQLWDTKNGDAGTSEHMKGRSRIVIINAKQGWGTHDYPSFRYSDEIQSLPIEYGKPGVKYVNSSDRAYGFAKCGMLGELQYIRTELSLWPHSVAIQATVNCSGRQEGITAICDFN